MGGAFDRKLRNVRRRWSVNVLLEQVGLVLLLGGVATALAVLTERALALRFVAAWHVAAGAGIAVLSAGALWLTRRPSPMRAALLLDERLATRERFSTALALARSEDPFASAAREEARNAAEEVRLGRHFPVRLTRRWLWASAAWLAFAGCLLLPEMDLFGHGAQRDEENRRAQELAQIKAEIKKSIAPIKTRVEQLGDKTLAEDLASLGDLQKALKAEDLKRQAIRKLGEMARKLSDLEQDPRVQSAQELQSMLRRLKGQVDALDQQLNHALARGDFSKAGEILKDLKERLESGKLSDEERKALAKQLKDLSEQLKKLAASRKALEDALKRAGCSKKLAGLSEEELRKALKKAGLSDKEIEKLLTKARACRMAAAKCKGLGKKLGQCSGGLLQGTGAGEMAGLLEDLDDLEAMQDRLKVVKASQEDIEDAIALLGQGQGQGPVCRADGAGPGRPVQAWGNRPTGDPEPTKNKATGVPNQESDGPIIYSTLFKGQQVKGKSKREYTAVVEAAKDRAAEAVTENQIPRQYQSAVKGYFKDMGGTGN